MLEIICLCNEFLVRQSAYTTFWRALLLNVPVHMTVRTTIYWVLLLHLCCIYYEDLLDKNYGCVYSTLSFAVYWLDTFIGLLRWGMCVQCSFVRLHINPGHSWEWVTCDSMNSDNIVGLVNLPTVLKVDLSVFNHCLQRERVNLTAAYKEWNKQSMRLNCGTKHFDFIHSNSAGVYTVHSLSRWIP